MTPEEFPWASPDSADDADEFLEPAEPPKLVAWPLLFGGVILPLICFAIGFPEMPEWQSGSSRAYAELLLSHKCSLPQYPLLLYSITCLALLFWRQDRFAGKFFVRLGIFLGVPVAVGYWTVFQVASYGLDANFFWPVVFSGLAVIVPWCAWWIRGFLFRRLPSEIFVVLAAALFFVTVCFTPYVLFVCLWCSTPWAFASYAIVSIRLIRGSKGSQFRFTLAELFAMIGLFNVHLGAWRISYVWMLEEYARLPTAPPHSCFVCSAAARGHPRVVRSEICETASGATVRVNDQLRRLKAFELLLASISPELHRQCRWIYDRLGPRIAAILFHPLLADVGYCLLKPLEWFAHLCLVAAIPKDLRLISDLYCSGSNRRPKDAAARSGSHSDARRVGR